jgi:ribose transport system permease protein
MLHSKDAESRTKCAKSSMSEAHLSVNTVGMLTNNEKIGRRALPSGLLTLGFFAVLFLIFSVFANNFFTVNSILNLLVQTSPLSIVCIGSALVLIVGCVDFSVGAMVPLGGTAVYWFIALTGVPIWESVIGSIVLCGLVGGANGFLVTRLRLPSFLATMGVAMVIRGCLDLLGRIASNHPTPPHVIPYEMGDLANIPVFRIFRYNGAGKLPTVVFPGISWIVIIMVIVAVVLSFATARTTIGRYAYLVGSNQEAARLSGIRVRLVKLIAFVLAAMLAGLSGILLAFRMSGPVSGAGYEMIGITCAMIGGASLSGGAGSIAGTVVGSFIIAILSMGLTMMNNSSPALPHLFNGAVVLTAVYLDQVRGK